MNAGQEVSTGCWDAGLWGVADVQITRRSAKPLGLWFGSVMSSDCHRSQEGEGRLPRSDGVKEAPSDGKGRALPPRCRRLSQ